jgi:hypothetical protein
VKRTIIGLVFIMLILLSSCVKKSASSVITPTPTDMQPTPLNNLRATPTELSFVNNSNLYLPQEYRDNRLIFVTKSKSVLDLRWDSNNTISLSEDYSLYQTYNIIEANSGFATEAGNIYTEKEDILPQISLPDGNEIILAWFSPNKEMVLVKAKSMDPNAQLQLDTESIMPSLEQNVFWIYSIGKNEYKALFSTPLDYSVSWMPDNKHLTLSGVCYGGREGVGIHTLDIDSGEMITLDENYAYCEGTVSFSKSPDSDFILLDGNLISTDGTTRFSVCEDNENDFSTAWSEDGTYGYVFCRSSSDYGTWGTLRRINTATQLVESNLLAGDLTIKPADMSVSPDNKWLVFAWRDGPILYEKNYGVWLVELNQP